MSDRTAWLKALSRFNTGDKENTEPCPNCGRSQLRVQYLANMESRVGYALFWCDACLHGISVSRVQVPEGAPVRPIDDPESLADIPHFERIE
ncbi:hypothetical protein PV416_42535 [Streptomyces ipomoeae]|nr:hypothetical protein [Streptomyces ipomoeae]MDX2699060.1 hypothetical protein [Streptomyces ipomoeae]MDX2827563.1 hypothetical protein [Streptomyces ipomoeae]MDX2844685.1 hypothetical protein [Streptomyces ipomoeae]MDX2880103.1 hypothetical protein [Streptomyces ipomoeae]